MKRVAIVFRLDLPGGVQSCIFSLVRGLNRVGIVPDILWDRAPAKSLLEAEKIEVGYRKLRFTVPTGVIDRLPNSLRYPAWVSNVIDGRKFCKDYDFFYIFHNGFIASKEFPHIYFLSGPPLLPQLEVSPSGVRGVPIRFFRFLYKSGLNKIAPTYDYHKDCQYVINSQYTSDLFEEAHGVRLPVVYPPIKIPKFDLSLEELRNRDSINFFSRIVDYKRPEFLLELAHRYPDKRCVVMGAVSSNRVAYFQSLQARAKADGLKNVTFIANPSHLRVHEELTRARFYIFPAINEHFGMTTPEAIALGAIPFVHDSGGQKEIVNNAAFRFVDSDFFVKFDEILNMESQELDRHRRAFVDHIQSYSEDIFINKMLIPLLNISDVNNGYLL